MRGELGRGGRYVAGHNSVGDEPGTGFTLFMDSVMRALPEAQPPATVFLPAGTSVETGRRLRGESWVTVAGLEDGVDPAVEARRLGCSHVLRDGVPAAVEE